MPREATVRISSFNYSREHEALVNVFKLRREIGLFHEPRLQVAQSSWHRQWTHSSPQIVDLCRSFNLVQYEVENNILENKLSAQRSPPRDIDYILSCISWVIQQIEREVPPSRMVIYMRAEQGLGFKAIMKLCPGRFYPSVRDDYIHFLEKIYNNPEFEYLRYKRL
jgi:hypothetical protein